MLIFLANSRMKTWQRVLVIGALMAATALAVAPGSWSPLAPLVNDWVPSLEHRHVVVMVHLLGFAALVMVLTWISGRLLWSRVSSCRVLVLGDSGGCAEPECMA